jgi:Tat protein translocase TatB subunit
MFDLGPEKIMVVLVLALVIFGPKQLPEIARNVGKAVRTLRGVQDDLRQQITSTIEPITGSSSVPMAATPLEAGSEQSPDGPDNDPAHGASFL